jgi:MFS family permease
MTLILDTSVSNLENLERPLFNRDFVLITLSSFVFFFNFHSFILLPVRIEELGGSESTIGFIMGMAAMATILTTPAVGIAVDRFGKKWFLAGGGILMSLTTLPFAYMDTLNYLFPLLRMLHGAALSLCFVSAGTLIADVSSASKRSQAIGIFGIFSIINFALAPLIGKLVVESFGFPDFFAFDFVFGFLAFFIALFIKEPRRIIKKGIQRGTFLTVLLRRGVFIAASALLIAGVGFVTVITFVPVFAGRISVEAYEIFFIAYTFSIIAIRVFGGWIPDKFGKKKASVPAFFVYSISILVLGFTTDWMGLLISGILFGLGHGLFYPAIYALVIDLSPEIDRGKAISICSVSFTFVGMLGVFIYGIVAENRGFPLMFEIMGVVSAIGFLVFSIFGKEHDKPYIQNK